MLGDAGVGICKSIANEACDEVLTLNKTPFHVDPCDPYLYTHKCTGRLQSWSQRAAAQSHSCSDLRKCTSKEYLAVLDP